ncbi:MAG: hypothetical protein V2I63_01455 [Pseudomonadales bacterium]|jgi:hypothetical protein|nr:hypothetical protein [Pseudomonadales bacterium]
MNALRSRPSSRVRRTLLGALAAVLALTGPLCDALCVAASEDAAALPHLAAAAPGHSECHGERAAEAQPTDGVPGSVPEAHCPGHDDAPPSGERVSALPPGVDAISYLLDRFVPPIPSVRLDARTSSETRSPGPPLTLLTLRILE